MGSQYLLNKRDCLCDGDILHSERREVARKEDAQCAASGLVRYTRGTRRVFTLLAEIRYAQADTRFRSRHAKLTRAIKVLKAQGDIPSIPLFKHAIELGPMFAIAYAALAGRYNDLSQPGQALEYAAQAYEYGRSLEA